MRQRYIFHLYLLYISIVAEWVSFNRILTDWDMFWVKSPQIDLGSGFEHDRTDRREC